MRVHMGQIVWFSLSLSLTTLCAASQVQVTGSGLMRRHEQEAHKNVGEGESNITQLARWQSLLASSDCSDTRAFVAGKLGDLQEEAASAVKSLEAALKDESANVRMQAALALAQIGEPASPAVAELQGALKDKETKVRGAAAIALREIGTAAKSAIPDLQMLLADTEVGSFAKEALFEIEPSTSSPPEQAGDVSFLRVWDEEVSGNRRRRRGGRRGRRR
eukprot:TRINITY_DN77643_c0_g1_i1.p1 TRINITY_DN77643_c0_g1~~TRINITY_DN77643_c0_g1_i1.p1  ORF type:complete len:219 (+),score=49.80 TRINITY_DN77643_c0_g1_i1:77-733(+)